MEKAEFIELKAKLKDEGMIPLKIVSDSMEPLLMVDMNYKVANLEEQPQRFDIVVFYRDEKLVAHYIWKTNQLRGISYTTRSLKDPGSDEIPVAEQDILGILVGKRLNFFKKLYLSFKYA